MKRHKHAVALLSVGLLLTAAVNPAVAAAAPGHGEIEVTGSSWAAAAVGQWVVDVHSQGIQADFTPSGSAQGRKDFANDANDMAISDIPFQGKDPTTHEPDTANGRQLAYLPIAAGGTAFPYHIKVGNQMVRNLRLSPITLAKIFTNKITNWNDPAVTADNNNHALPSLPIIPVVHSEGAGTTAMFTEYLAKVDGSDWAPCNGGVDAETEYFPLNCGKSHGPQKAQSGSDGVMNFLTNPNANGSIGVEEYSYALALNYPVAKLLNKAGYYTLPTQYNVAVALTKAVFDLNANDQNYLTADLSNVYVNTDPRTYPLSSYVYSILPIANGPNETPPGSDPRMTSEKKQSNADFLNYAICQGQKEIGPIGYSSLPINLVQAGFAQIAKLHQADAAVDVAHLDASNCGNPTFDRHDLSKNLLAVEAPQPPACDKQGAGPCDAGVGSYNGSPAGAAAANKAAAAQKANVSSDAATAGGGAAAAGGAARPAAAASASQGADALAFNDSGLVATSNSEPIAVPQTLSTDDQAGIGVILIILAVVLFVLVLIGPALYARRLAIRSSGDAS
ncbi:ABC-type phosphate transport system, substrate-binding protein [Frankineae bacterium MT45]|nr:ABC-type phosphate transport system, substrate-binding protein [Frankineae bacterium MT45]